jgi:hypothetical protein
LRLLPFRGSAAVASGAVSKARLRGPGFRRLLPDVYVAAGVPMDQRLWCHAALLYAGPGATIGGLSAAMVWGAPVGHADNPIQIIVPRRRVLRPNSDRLSIARVDLRSSEIDTIGRLRVTTPVRTVFDLVRRHEQADVVIAVESLLRRRVATIAQLTTLAARHAGARAGRALSEALSLAEPRSESPMETRCRLTIVNGGMPCPSVQVEVYDNAGRFVARLDMAYEEWKIGIEYEGDHHRERGAFQCDLARVNRLTALGWVIVQVGPQDVFRHPEQLVRQIKALIARRSAGMP